MICSLNLVLNMFHAVSLCSCLRLAAISPHGGISARSQRSEFHAFRRRIMGDKESLR